MLISYWFAAGLALATTPALAKPDELEIAESPITRVRRETTTEEVAIGRDDDDRMTVAVTLDGKGPYRFLVDTGAERTIISRQLASRLQLASGRDAVLHSVIGVNDVRTVHIPKLEISSKVISVVDAPALEAMDIGADGMLGIDSLRSQRVLFDFKANTMSITPADKPLARLDGETIVVRARSRNGRLIFTHARIDGQKVTVIVDTGSQVTIGNLALHRSLIKRRLAAILEPMTIESVMGEKLSVQVALVRKLELGGIHLDDLPIAFADAHIFGQLDLKGRPALLLGMNALRAFDRISIDFEEKKVHFVLPRTSMRDTARFADRGTQ